MRRDSLRSLGGTVVAILLYAATVAAAEANLPGPDSTAKELVDAALASELNGPSDLRQALLKQGSNAIRTLPRPVGSRAMSVTRING